MKKYALPLAVVSAITLQACNQEPTATEEPEKLAEFSASLDTSAQRLSYGIAYGFGQRMVADDFPLDAAAFSLGLADAIAGNESRMTQEEIAAEMQAFQEQAMAEQQAQMAAAGEANLAASKAYLEANAAREGVQVTESGLQYEVLEAGDGATPGPDDTVEVHYRGTLVDGTEFDSSYSRGQPVSFGVGQVIPGWTEALQLMQVGSKWKLAIPADLAYGAGGAGQVIGPNAALVFEVELLSVQEAAAPAGAEGGAAEEAPAEEEGAEG